MYPIRLLDVRLLLAIGLLLLSNTRLQLFVVHCRGVLSRGVLGRGVFSRGVLGRGVFRRVVAVEVLGSFAGPAPGSRFDEKPVSVVASPGE